MKFKYIRQDRHPWPRPLNHLDGRECPDCGGTVHGPDGQRKHDKKEQRDRETLLQLNEAITQICNYLGIKVTIAGADEGTEDSKWSWGAAVTGCEPDVIEAAE